MQICVTTIFIQKLKCWTHSLPFLPATFNEWVITNTVAFLIMTDVIQQVATLNMISEMQRVCAYKALRTSSGNAAWLELMKLE